MNNEEIGIKFNNKVKNSEDFNIFNYRNFYNGAGVAVADINNDGLTDVFFTSNMGENKLYLNKGNWKFEDISQKAGITESGKWNTGVVMVDINHDGWLDIYVCNAGINKWKNQQYNTLFINQHNLTFKESAQEYGLDEGGYSTHAAFLDYDLDGDLDCYMLNNSFIPVNTLDYDNNRNLRAKDWPVRDFLKGGGDKLLKNENGKFVDVSEEAGIYGSLIGFGLGVSVGDINEDGYPDLYISNDFYEKDYLYINQQNGTFKEEIEDRIGHLSMFSMGSDMADVNNDGKAEIFTTDMLPRDENRLKTTTSFENHYFFKLKQERGFYRQFQQNSLQLGNQDGTFTEIANFSQVAGSDWSWGALMFDADNDSKTDIYVCNGIYHDLIDQDFIDFFANEINQKMILSGEKKKFDNIVKHMPSRPIPNNFFQNKGNLSFEEKGAEFGFSTPSFSNGAAYADLDNDGDLDLVVNNINMDCFVYKNNAIGKNNYIKIKLQGEEKNTYGIGAKVKIFIKDQILSREVSPNHGFQSSTEYPLTFGLGKNTTIDSISIDWTNKKRSIYRDVKVNQTLQYSIKDAQKAEKKVAKVWKGEYFVETKSSFESHKENDYEDYYQEKNIPIKLSTEGPKAAVGDVNGDKKEDIYICGANGQSGQLYLQTGAGFTKKKVPDFELSARFEGTAASFLDIDQDGDLDLYVGSGGNEHDSRSPSLVDRIYLNDGKGNFKITQHILPPNAMNTSVVAPNDYDHDGDVDIFVGSRSFPKEYGLAAPSFLYQNKGNGTFEQVNVPQFANLGMVRDAIWENIDGDKELELILVGDWLHPIVFEWKNKKFQEQKSNMADYTGFWGAVKATDIDNDGDKDLVLGNIGQNFGLLPPLKLFVGDFDNNGITDKILTKKWENKDIPVFLKKEMMEQFPFLKKKNLKHEEYAKRSVDELFEKGVLDKGKVNEVKYFQSAIAFNDGKGNFSFEALPSPTQYSCINAIEIIDVNQDGKNDVVLAGNSNQFIPQFGTLDGSFGDVLINEGKGKFSHVPHYVSGLSAKGEVRQLIYMQKEGKLLSLANNRVPQIFTLKKP